MKEEFTLKLTMEEKRFVKALLIDLSNRYGLADLLMPDLVDDLIHKFN
jgi:hypothetical protein